MEMFAIHKTAYAFDHDFRYNSRAFVVAQSAAAAEIATS
jgi:hypothetical protein